MTNRRRPTCRESYLRHCAHGERRPERVDAQEAPKSPIYGAPVSRRVRALVVAGVLFLILFFVALFMPVPYVILGPGPTLNTLGTDDHGRQIIAIRGPLDERDQRALESDDSGNHAGSGHRDRRPGRLAPE